MNLMNLTASAIVLVALIGCGGGSGAPADPLAGPPAGPQPTVAGCVAGTERIAKISGDGQTAPHGALLPERPTVRATCQSFVNRGMTIPMAGAAVHWQVVSGSGRIDGATTTVPKQLDADGTTSVAWTLSYGFGAQAVRATLAAPNPSITAEFSATVAASTTAAQSCSDTGGTDHGASAVIATHTTWTAAGSPHRGGTMLLDNGAVLSIEAGAVVCVAAIDQLVDSGTVLAEGTSSAPIRFVGTALRVASALTHVQAENVPSVGSRRPAVVIADSTFRWSEPRDPRLCAQIVVSGTAAGGGGAVWRTHIEGYGSADCAALRLLEPQDSWGYDSTEFSVRIIGSVGDAVSVLATANPANTLFFTRCEVSGSGRHGIVVSAPTPAIGVMISGCNLSGNAGDSVVNQGMGSVSATGNWWGDPAGPGGPSGDGVSGLVDAADPLAAPVTRGW